MGTGSGTNFTTTNNMGLKQPTPGVCGALGVEPAGTSWLELLNASLGTLDSHTHAPGFGAQVPAAGISINADLPFGSNNATGLRSTRFSAIALGAIGSSDLGCLLVSGVDLYYVDGSGNQIRITSAGAVAGTPGSISGLVSPAAASYTPASKLFAFTSSSGFAANLSCGPVLVTDATVSSGKAATLQVPASLAANYSMTLPAALPGATGLLDITSAGVMATFGTIAGSALTLPGALTVAGQISGVTDPTTAQMAATKNYVDATSIPPVGIFWGCDNSSPTVGQDLVPGSRGGTVAAGNCPWVAPSSGVIRDLYVRYNVPGSGGTGTFTVYKNGVATALSVSATLSATSSGTLSDTSDSVSFVAGDLITLRCVATPGLNICAAAVQVSKN